MPVELAADRYEAARRSVPMQARIHVGLWLATVLGEHKATGRTTTGVGSPFLLGRRAITVILQVEVDEAGESLLHVSVSSKARRQRRGDPTAPTWDELVAVRALVWPDDAEVVQILPSGSSLYVNVAEVLHLWGPVPAEVPHG